MIASFGWVLIRGAKSLRRHMLARARDVETHLLLDGREMVEPLAHLGGHPDAGQIGVTIAVAEPSTHLKEGVVGGGGPNEERDRQPLERKARERALPPTAMIRVASRRRSSAAPRSARVIDDDFERPRQRLAAGPPRRPSRRAPAKFGAGTRTLLSRQRALELVQGGSAARERHRRASV